MAQVGRRASLLHQVKDNTGSRMLSEKFYALQAEHGKWNNHACRAGIQACEGVEVAQAKSERSWPENSLRRQQSKERGEAGRDEAGRVCRCVGRSGQRQGRDEVPVARKVSDGGEAGRSGWGGVGVGTE